MLQSRLGLFRILLSGLAAGLLLVGVLSGAGASLADSPAATVVTMGNEQLSFSGQPATGSIAASGGGYDVINPGFNLSSGQETGGWSGNPDLLFGTGSNGQPTLSGNVTKLPQSGSLSAAPTQATVTVAVGDQLVVLTGGGSYYLVNVTAASPQSVQFSYQAGTVQPIPTPQPPVPSQPAGTTGPTSTPQPTVQPQPSPGSQTVTVTVGGQQATFASRSDTATITTTGGGFSFQSGQETPGSAADMSISTDSSGQLILSGVFAIMQQGQDGSLTADVPGQHTGAISSANNSADLIFQSASGNYVLVQLDDVSTDSVKFNYVAATSASPAPSSQPATSPTPTGGSSQNPTAGPQLLTLTDTPIVLNGRTFVPMRELFEALGATIQWDGVYQVVTATKGDTAIKLQIGNIDAYINGNQQQLDDPPFIQNGHTYVPLRFAAEALGENVSYDATTTKVTFGNYYFYINPAQAPGQGTNSPPVTANQPSPSPTPTPSPNPSQTPTGTLTADGDHYTGDGVDVTADAGLADGGVNGTIQVTVTVNAPTDVSDVGVGQSYDEFGQTIMTNLSQLAHSGNTWTFALFADQLNKNQPFQVQLYQNALSGSGQPAFATILFTWPANLLQYMAS